MTDLISYTSILTFPGRPISARHDCVIRAFVILTDESYDAVDHLLLVCGRRDRRTGCSSDTIAKAAGALGLKWVQLSRKMSTRNFCLDMANVPMVVAFKRSHAFAVARGKIIDTQLTPDRGMVYGYYVKK